MPNTRSGETLETSEKSRRQGLDDEVTPQQHARQTGRDLERTERKTRRHTKLYCNGTQTGERRKLRMRKPQCTQSGTERTTHTHTHLKQSTAQNE